MKQAEDTRTGELPGLAPYRRRHRGRNRGDRVGPYGGDHVQPVRKQARLLAGLTQPELAKAARVSERTVRNWECRVGDTEFLVLVKLWGALHQHGCPVATIDKACPGVPRHPSVHTNRQGEAR